jgi:hypothetical protein
MSTNMLNHLAAFLWGVAIGATIVNVAYLL